MKTVGILREDKEHRVWDVGVSVGVIAGIVPSTNPTSTVIYKTMIALKAGSPIVFSPHPECGEMHRQGRRAGCGGGRGGWLPQGRDRLHSHPDDGCRQ